SKKARKAAEKKAKKASLKQVFLKKGSGMSVYGPSIIDHCILEAGLKPNTRLVVGMPAGGLTRAEVERLVMGLGRAEVLVGQLDRPGQRGYILCKSIAGAGAGGSKGAGGAGGGKGVEEKEDKQGEKEDADKVVYEEFLPQVLAQHEGAVVQSFGSFDAAVDSFFGRVVEQKLN
ncbi:unnamed protein product, partial [Discosporangium mesarthrocarpum]